MKAVSEFLKPEEVTVTYVDDGIEKTDAFTISCIPALHAQRIMFAAIEAFKNQNFSALDKSVTVELFKYVAHNGIVLENEALVTAHVPSLEASLQLQVLMGEKNFGFFGRASFQKSMEALQKILG